MKSIWIVFMIIALGFTTMAIQQKKAKEVKIEERNGILEVQNPHQSLTTFKVCEVKKEKKLLPTRDYKTVVMEKMVDEPNENDRMAAIEKNASLSYSEKWKLQDDKNFKPQGIPNRTLEDFSNKEAKIISSDVHPFIGAIHTAYAQHYPVTISPDMVWLMIAQGFARHINENEKTMRHYFVDFEGKKNLNVDRDHFIKGSEDNDWEGVFPEFNEQIGKHVGKGLTDLVTGDFSTTSIVEKTAFQITLMDAMKSYFTYSVTTSCGIPEITLEGTVEDWENIETKAKDLERYELDWWISELLPILKEFTNAAKGDVNNNFWESIYKWNEVGSGSPYITGWILEFFPYLKYDDQYVKSRAIGSYARQVNNSKNTPTRREQEIEVTTKNFSSGLSQADFLWNYLGQKYEMEFVAGFVGYQQDTATMSLRPEISWAVVDKGMTPSDQEIEDYEKGGDKKYLESIKKE